MTLSKSVVYSSHAGMSIYSHFTTQSVTQRCDRNDNQLFLCKLFDTNSSTGKAMNRPQFYSEQEVIFNNIS